MKLGDTSVFFFSWKFFRRFKMIRWCRVGAISSWTCLSGLNANDDDPQPLLESGEKQGLVWCVSAGHIWKPREAWKGSSK